MSSPTHARRARIGSLSVVGLCLLGGLFVLPSEAAAQRRRPYKTGIWRKRHVPEGWVLHHSKHYQIQSQAGPEKAKRLAAHMESMLAVYKKLFKPAKAISKRYAIKLFKNRQEFIGYGASPGAGAYYSPTEKEMVCYDTGKWMDEEDDEEAAPATGDPREIDFEKLRKRMGMDILGAAAHEGWHQYFHWYVVSWVYLPSWINEGMGDYFYTAKPKKVKGRKIPAELGRRNNMRLPVIKRAVAKGSHVPLAKILNYTQRDYYSNPGVCYAQGWALCQFFLHGADGKYAKLVPDFIKRFKKEKSWKKITEYIFERKYKVDLDELEKEWVAWVTEQK